MGFFDGIFGGGKPNIKKMKKKRDIDGLIKALKFEDYRVLYVVIGALSDIKYAPGEFDDKVLGHLTAVMTDNKIIPDPNDNYGVRWPSLSRLAASAIERNSSTPDITIKILINNTRIVASSLPEYRKDAYEYLARSYSDASEDNKEKIFNTMAKGLENETNPDVKRTIESELSHRIYPKLKFEDRIKNYNSLLQSDDEKSRGEAATCLARYCGIDGVHTLIKALDGDNENAYRGAAWFFSNELRHHENDLSENELRIILNDVNEIFIKVIQNSELVPGAHCFNNNVIMALCALRHIGNQSAIPALIDLQNRLQEKINQEGIQKTYIHTDYGSVALFSDTNIAEVKDVIESINERNKVI